VICGGRDRTAEHISFNVRILGKRHLTYSDLLPLAVSTGFHDSHQMGMLALLLRLGSSPSGARNIDTVLGHDGETRQSDLCILLWLL
jgi:hypothetical protein